MERPRVFFRLLLGFGLLSSALSSVADSGPRSAGATKVAFIPPDSPLDKVMEKAPAAAMTEGGDFVFSAPPRGSYEEEVATYQPITEYLSKITGKRFVYKYSDNWLSYSRDMTNGVYDLVFDGPAFNGWRMDKMSHTPLVKLPEDFVFVVITRKDNAQITELKQLAGRKVCAHAPPNLGTLTMLSQFDNPARQPVIQQVKGWDNNYRAMIEGKCAGTVVPIKNFEKNDKGMAKILYRHRAMPNQAFSAGPRITPEMRSKIQQALLSQEGKSATAKLRSVYAGKDFVPARAEEYAGLGRLLKDSLYYY